MDGRNRFGRGVALGVVAAASLWAPAAGAAALRSEPQPGASDAARAEDMAFAKRLSSAFKRVAGSAEPAVVNISNRRRVLVRESFYDSGRRQLVEAGQGSGVIFRQDGYVVTNNHVVQQAEEVVVRLSDGRELPAKLVGRDESLDLAVLKLPEGTYPSVQFGDSDALDVGEWVIAIGSPFGLAQTVTAGIVSAKGRSVTPRETGRTHEDFIQTDAAINPGNSGGPLLNLEGKIIGINSAIASRTGGYEGIGFAIPGNTARAVAENIIANGRLVRGWLGVELRDGKSSPLGRGVLVASVVEDSPADRAGLKEGDVIVRFQNRPLSEMQLRTAIAVSPPGTKAEIELVREGRETKISATIGDQAAAMGISYVPSLGASVQTVNRVVARELNYRDTVRGVRVTELDPAGRAAAAGLRVNDVVAAVANEEVASAQQFAEMMKQADFNRGVRMNIIRRGRMGYLDVRD